jgi:hypothetical protein
VNVFTWGAEVRGGDRIGLYLESGDVATRYRAGGVRSGWAPGDVPPDIDPDWDDGRQVLSVGGVIRDADRPRRATGGGTAPAPTR